MKKVFKYIVIILLAITFPIWAIPYLVFVTVKDEVEHLRWFE